MIAVATWVASGAAPTSLPVGKVRSVGGLGGALQANIYPRNSKAQDHGGYLSDNRVSAVAFESAS
jgi:hypothetical protein